VRRLALGVLSILSVAGSALGAGRTLDAEPMTGVKLRVDGVIKEWPGKMTELAEAVRGKGERVSGQIGYDDKHLYVAFDVRDDKLVRSSSAGEGEDHGTLLIAFPDARGRLTLYELDLYPGDPGKIDASVRRKGGAVRGAKIVEAP
jgi:hypothetical protein